MPQLDDRTGRILDILVASAEAVCGMSIEEICAEQHIDLMLCPSEGDGYFLPPNSIEKGQPPLIILPVSVQSRRLEFVGYHELSHWFLWSADPKDVGDPETHDLPCEGLCDAFATALVLGKYGKRFQEGEVRTFLRCLVEDFLKIPNLARLPADKRESLQDRFFADRLRSLATATQNPEAVLEIVEALGCARI